MVPVDSFMHCSFSTDPDSSGQKLAAAFVPRCFADSSYIGTLPETNIAPKNRPSQEEISSSNRWFSGANC